MAGTPGRREALLAGYVAVMLVPLLGMAGVIRARDSVVVFADALGFVAVSLLALQVFSSGRWGTSTRHIGLRLVLMLHRQAGKVIVGLVVAHIALLVVDDPRRLALFDFLSAPNRARAGAISLCALGGLAWTSIRRRELKLSYERWRVVHLGLTVAAIGGAFAHVMWVDDYSAAPMIRLLVLVIVLAAGVALFWFRVAQPYSSAARPYRVEQIVDERGDAVTVQLTADGHAGFRFAPGQFARLRLAHRPYGLEDHPFTLASSAAQRASVELTVKALGDFTRTLRELPAQSEVFVDGPYGEAVDAHPEPAGRLLVAAGIGITPAISVLRTAMHRGDHRPALLLYGSRCWEQITFREELAELERAHRGLRVVHVLSQPESWWLGERGRVQPELVARVAPRDLRMWSGVVCGPVAMIDPVADALIARGMRRRALRLEGFE